MPSASRNLRRKRRIKRNLSITRRALYTEAVARAKTSVIFYAVLSKLGGEIELSKHDIDTAAQNLNKLSFEVEPSALEGYFMVKIVEAETPAGAPAEVIEAAAEAVETTVEIETDVVNGPSPDAVTLGIAPNDIVDEANGI